MRQEQDLKASVRIGLRYGPAVVDDVSNPHRKLANSYPCRVVGAQVTTMVDGKPEWTALGAWRQILAALAA